MFTGELKINDVRGSFTIDPRSVLYGPTLRLTVWKFENFSVTQILREVKVGESRVAKFAILTHSEGLNFHFVMNSALLEG